MCCHCSHLKKWHEHYTRSTHCSFAGCRCDSFRLHRWWHRYGR